MLCPVTAYLLFFFTQLIYCGFFSISVYLIPMVNISSLNKYFIKGIEYTVLILFPILKVVHI